MAQATETGRGQATETARGQAVETARGQAVETARGVVAQWEVDFFDHMNVRHYVGRFDDATWNFFAGLGMPRDYFTGNGRAMFAVQQNISYLGELRAGDIIAVETGICEIAARRIVFEHRMRNGVSGEVAAVCELTGVHVDLATRRACPFPDEVMRACEARLGDAGAGEARPGEKAATDG